MRKSVRFWVVSLFAIMSLALVACGGSSSSGPPMPAAPQAPASGAVDNGGDSGGDSGGVTLEIGIKGEELAFDTDTLEATAAEGEEITLEFENTSQTQEHNWILLDHNDMDQAEEYNDHATTFVDNAYYPEDDDDMNEQVIAHVETLQPGEADSVVFESPGPGEYLYICTVPGHFAAGDYGTLTIN